MVYMVPIYHGISHFMVYHSMVYTTYVISHGIYHTSSVISQLHITASAIWSIAILVAILDNMYNVDRYVQYMFLLIYLLYNIVREKDIL